MEPQTHGSLQPYGTYHHQPPRPQLNNTLYPSVPRFQPNGMELQRYDPGQLTPPSSTESPGMATLQRYIAETHVKHTHDIARVEHHARAASDEVETMKAMLGNDLRTLESKIEQLQLNLQARMEVIEPPGPPTEAMLHRFEPEYVAAVYVEQAEVYEETARKLRNDAEHICGQSQADSFKAPELLEGPAESDVSAANGNLGHTPTHMPPPRPSRAVEIKAPVATEALQNMQACAHDAAEAIWQPLAIRQMPVSPVSEITATESFTWEFLHTRLGGHQWSPGFYFKPNGSALPSKAYWSLDADYEPFLPSHPGQHGAKLTAFFNDTLSAAGEAPDVENYHDTPVFISQDGGKTYRYFGNYSQHRFSDRLDYDRVMETVRAKVREYWAKQLVADRRPAWVTNALMQHFWPKPAYEGPIPTDSGVQTPATAETAATRASTAVLEKKVTRALADYAWELQDWEREAKMKVKLLKAETIMAAFDKADADEEPGLRLWFEYLQCVGYDQGFYEMLVGMKDLPPAPLKSALRAKASVETPPSQGKMIPSVNGVRPAPAPASTTPSRARTAIPNANANGCRGGSKPSERPTDPHPKKQPGWEEVKASTPNLHANADLTAAQQLNDEFKSGGQKHSKRGGGAGKTKTTTEAYVAPHLKAKQGGDIW